MEVITAERYAELQALNDEYEGIRKGRTSMQTSEIPQALAQRFTNKERGQMEVYRFMTDKPDSYFGYVRESDWKLTTWNGDVLGDVQPGKRFKVTTYGGSNRMSITVTAINGRRYHGTYYVSSGDYCRIKAYKGGD